MRQHQNHATPSVVLTLPQGGDLNSSNNSVALRALLLQRNILLVACTTLVIILLQSHWGSSSSILSGSSSFLPSASSRSTKTGESRTSCEINLGKYKGPVYHSVDSGTVGEPKCLLDSKWMRVSLHSVQFPDSNTVYDDWMWIDYHDRINVLVEDETDDGEEPRFLVFEQTKYALEGRTSLAIIGGIIEVGEDPESAARREVEEEMNGLVCEKFHFLGRHRTDVNRGMGWLNGFLATQCTNRDSPKAAKKNHLLAADEVGVADTEKQNLKSITLTELRQAVLQGKFIEVQWTATVTQALLKLYSFRDTKKLA
jgi:ADP-ribose pyrophosphatase YjhB (NUDIX family)